MKLYFFLLKHGICIQANIFLLFNAYSFNQLIVIHLLIKITSLLQASC